tara:strand:- start:7240 stop:8424 length:1185 start_codon:yes stop_codon:yes gene_type:complete
MNNFISFIKNPEKYTSINFFNDNKKEIDKLNNIKLENCKFKKVNLKFENESYQKLYDNSPGLPTIKTILDNPKKYYIIMGGMRSVGARYPDYIINKKDILYLIKVLEEYGIMDIPISNIKLVIEKCIELVQEKLKTFLFNDIKKSRWLQFDEITNSFRNMCMNIGTYEKYKNKFVPTSLSMLLYFTGDCREHRLLLLYLMRIYLYYNDTNDTYLVEPVYASGGHGEFVNKQMIFVNNYYEHTFPILINKTTQDIIVIDALGHVTKIVKYPIKEWMSYQNIKSIKIKNKFYYINGYYKNTQKPYLYELTDWWSNTPCQYTDNKIFNNKVFLYGIPFKPINIKYVFDKPFNNLITKRLFNSEMCSPKFNKLKLHKTMKKKKSVRKKLTTKKKSARK